MNFNYNYACQIKENDEKSFQNFQYKNKYIDINENNSSSISKKDEIKLECIDLIMDSISNCQNQ